MAERERTVGGLLARLGADNAGMARALTALAASGRDGDAMPWYVEAILGLGAWLAGLLLCGSIAGLLAVTLGLDEPFLPLLLLGALAVAVGVAVRRRGPRFFARQFALSWSVGGQALIIAGMVGETGSAGAAAAVQVLVAAALLPLLRDGLHQFIAAALACGLVAYALMDAGVGQAAGVLVLVTLPPALLLLLRPTRPLDTRGTAYALLLAGPVVSGLLGGSLVGVEIEGHWLARAVYIGAFGFLLWLLREESEALRRPLAFAAAAVAAVLAPLLSLGAVACLLLLLLAYLLGSRALAVVGTVGVVGFIAMYYYQLEVTLLAKSGLLVAAGAAFLALWWALGGTVQRRGVGP